GRAKGGESGGGGGARAREWGARWPGGRGATRGGVAKVGGGGRVAAAAGEPPQERGISARRRFRHRWYRWESIQGARSATPGGVCLQILRRVSIAVRLEVGLPFAMIC